MAGRGGLGVVDERETSDGGSFRVVRTWIFVVVNVCAVYPNQDGLSRERDRVCSLSLERGAHKKKATQTAEQSIQLIDNGDI